MRTLTENQVETLIDIAKEYRDKLHKAKEWDKIVKTDRSARNVRSAEDQCIVANRFMFNLGLEI